MSIPTYNKRTNTTETDRLLRADKNKPYLRLPTQDLIDDFLPPPTVSANQCRNHSRLTYQNVLSAFTYTTMMIIGWWLVECKNKLNSCLHSNNLNKIVTVQFLIGAGALVYNTIFSFRRFSHEDVSCQHIRKIRAHLITYKIKILQSKPLTQHTDKMINLINLYTKHHYKCRLNCSGKKLAPSPSDLGHKISIFIINLLEGLLTNFLIRSTTLMAYNDVSSQHTDTFPTSLVWWMFLIPPSILFAVLKTYYETISQSKANSQWYLNDSLRELCCTFQEKDPSGIDKIRSVLNSHPALFPVKDFKRFLDTYSDNEKGELNYS